MHLMLRRSENPLETGSHFLEIVQALVQSEHIAIREQRLHTIKPLRCELDVSQHSRGVQLPRRLPLEGLVGPEPSPRRAYEDASSGVRGEHLDRALTAAGISAVQTATSGEVG